MSSSTTGLEVRSGSRVLREAVELVSSMRFAISLLTVICIASVIGTVVKQHEPLVNYVNQFGPFWAEVFGAVKLYSIYSPPEHPPATVHRTKAEADAAERDH